VSLAIAFDEDTPLALVLECHPDVIAKGADYTAATTVGAAEVINWVADASRRYRLLPGRSTTRC
jgi:D-beta-D-heptose 7-phosphate kinase/D-beta-D-heptose 1-phosphate adenosyltransferase